MSGESTRRAAVFIETSPLSWVLSPEILVVVCDLFFEFREWASDCYVAPSGGEHLATAQIEGQILRVVSGQLGRPPFAQSVDHGADASPVTGSGAHAARLDRGHQRTPLEKGRVVLLRGRTGHVCLCVANAAISRVGVARRKEHVTLRPD